MVVAGVDIAPDGATPTTTSVIAHIAALAANAPVPYIAAEWGAVAAALSQVIPSLLAQSPTLLLAVATLSSSVASLLSAPLTLSILALSVLSGPPIAAARSCHGFNLVAQPLHLIECRGFVALPCAALSRLGLPHSLLRLA